MYNFMYIFYWKPVCDFSKPVLETPLLICLCSVEAKSDCLITVVFTFRFQCPIISTSEPRPAATITPTSADHYSMGEECHPALSTSASDGPMQVEPGISPALC